MDSKRVNELREECESRSSVWVGRAWLTECLDEIERLQGENHDLKILVETTLDTKNAKLKEQVGPIVWDKATGTWVRLSEEKLREIGADAIKENIRLREENEKLKKQYEEFLSGKVIHAHHRAVLEENFALAASQCKDGYSDEGGRWRCKYEDEIEKLRKSIVIYGRENEEYGATCDRLYAALEKCALRGRALSPGSELWEVAKIAREALEGK